MKNRDIDLEIVAMAVSIATYMEANLEEPVAM